MRSAHDLKSRIALLTLAELVPDAIAGHSGKDALVALAGVYRDYARLHYLDGRELYGPADAVTLPLPDALHPDAATHHLIGERFADRVFGPGGAFPPAAIEDPGRRRVTAGAWWRP